MKKLAIAFGILGALSVAAVGGYRFARRDVAGDSPTTDARAIYHCPMHPSVVSDHPGHCPICGMTLVARNASETVGASHKTTLYRSTMLPNETSDHPAKDSMGMDMVPVEVEESSPAREAVTGRSALSISSGGRALVGVRTEIATEAPFARSIRTVGEVTYDDTRLYHIHTKVQGWIEHVFAGAAGDVVTQGDPLLEIYSPGLLASQEEYLIAIDNRAHLENATLDGVRENADALVEAARTRLRLQDITDEQIDALARTRRAQKTMVLYSPLSGTITSRNVSHGMRIESETSLLGIAELSRVWVVASVYEDDLPFVREGQQAEITLSFLPGRDYRGRVSLVSPVVDPTTRTIQVRIELDNRDGRLKPGMFAEVQLKAELGPRLTVPKDAVLRTGERDLVFVSPSEGVFQPRQVTIGLALPDRYEVTSGLAAGERVLSAAGFFVDSESRLKSALHAAGEKTP